MKSSLSSPVHVPSISPLALLRRWLHRLNGETRTRILFLYIVTMIGVFAASIPVFRYFLVLQVNDRVRDDLFEEVEEFETAYDRWHATTEPSIASIQQFIDEFLAAHLPEDDNFQILILEGELYRASTTNLPDVIAPESDLFQEWLTLQIDQAATVPSHDPEIGNIIYKTSVLTVDNTSVGLFVNAHLSAGEQNEALAGVVIFAKVAIGVLVVSLLLAWLGSKRLLKPMQQLSQTAKAINETHLSKRLSVTGSGELAELAKTFNAMLDRVELAFDSQRNFINDASHELRTPLTIVQGHLELMGDDPAEQQETLALVMDELDRMGRLVNDLLLLVKVEQPDFWQYEPLNVAQFTDDVFHKITTLADRSWQLVNRAQGTIVADRQRLTGAIINLVHNAVQHTQANDQIELGAERVNGHMRFWVRDTGEGIAPADQARIFDRFARATNTYRKSEGFGLGLAIVKTIAEAHHGYVELTSQVGVGATFSLFLPVHTELGAKRS